MKIIRSQYSKSITLRIGSFENRFAWPINLTFDWAHWGDAPWTADGFRSDGKPAYRGVQHKEAPRPHEWRWWRLFSVYFVNLVAAGSVNSICTALRWWIYTPRGSLLIDFVIDRREAT